MRTVPLRPIGLLVGFLAFAVLVSGCFQTAGAALEPTLTPQGGIAIALEPTNEPPLPTAITEVGPTLTPTVAQLEFPTPTPTQTEMLITETFAAPTLDFNITATVTETPTVAPVDFQPLPTYTLPPTYTPAPTYTDLPTYTPFPTPTVPPILTPTQPPAVAGLSQQGLDATQTQEALFIQATDILATVTAASAMRETQIATLQGTFPPPEGGGAPTPLPPPAIPGAPQPTATGAFIPVYVTATPGGTPGIPGSGADGYFDGTTCRYFVLDGDRLIRIALRFNTTPEAIARASKLINADLIRPGQYLTIPNCNAISGPLPTQIIVIGADVPPTSAPPGTIPSLGNGGKTYVVQEGETLYGIASRFGVSVTRLAQLNGIRDISLIYIGQRLQIP